MSLIEKLLGKDRVVVNRKVEPVDDVLVFDAEWEIRKYKSKSLSEAIKIGEKPYEIKKFKGNIVLYEGLQALLDLAGNLATIDKWCDGTARLGVGDGTATEDPTQTGLQGTNQFYKTVPAGGTSRSAHTIQWVVDFADAEANFAWNEFTVDNGATQGKNLNRKVQASGTKSGGTWTLTLRITISPP